MNIKPPQSPVQVRVARSYTASPERVYDAWFDTKTVGRWLFATPNGKVVKAEIDARVGGLWCIVDERESGEVDHHGEYLELIRPRRIVFTFTVEKHGRDTDRVVVEIIPQDTGCQLTLTHDMKPESADYSDRTREGWTHILNALAKTLS